MADRSTKWILWQRGEDKPAAAHQRPGIPLWEREDEPVTAPLPPVPPGGAEPGTAPVPGGVARPGGAPRPAPPSGVVRSTAAPAAGGAGVPATAAGRAAAGRAHPVHPAIPAHPVSPPRPVRPEWMGTPGEHDLIRRIVEERDISVRFQPIRDTVRDQVVAFEALTRGPEGPLHRPDRLFAAARLAGLAGRLDWVCRAEAFRLMLESGLPPAVSLFVNVESDSLIEPCPDDLLSVVWDATARLRVLIDVTGRALSQYPFEVLETVRRARAAGWGVAVGDVEFSASGLALLPTLEPDVVKINHNVLTVAGGYAAAAVTAVLSETEQTGAGLLVDRVEDEAARRVSRAVGATLHTGRLFGYPEKLPARLPVPVVPVRLRQLEHAPEQSTPWNALTEQGAHVAAGVTLAEADNLLRTFAVQAANAPLPPVVALVVPDGGTMSEQTRLSYEMLLGRCPLVLAMGHDLASFQDWRARAAELPPGHPLLREACLVALSPTQSMALVARRDPSLEVTVDLAISQQPAACRELMRLLIDTLDTLAGGVRHGRP